MIKLLFKCKLNSIKKTTQIGKNDRLEEEDIKKGNKYKHKIKVSPNSDRLYKIELEMKI